MGYARVPNGVGDFVIQSPTFSSNNDELSSLDSEVLCTKKVIQVVDLIGRDISYGNKKFLLYIYDDGSVEKTYIVE